jgi:hypothetical protein
LQFILFNVKKIVTASGVQNSVSKNEKCNLSLIMLCITYYIKIVT